MFVISLLTVHSVIPSESANIGLIIGIAVVVLIVIVTTVLIIIVYYKKCYQKNQKCQPESDSETKDVSILTPLNVYLIHSEDKLLGIYIHVHTYIHGFVHAIVSIVILHFTLFPIRWKSITQSLWTKL